MAQHPSGIGIQAQLIQILKRHITDIGGLELEQLYEASFTNLHAEGINGVFEDKAVTIIALLKQCDRTDNQRAQP